MQILITDILDAAIIIGFTGAFLLLDVLLKNRFKLGMSTIGPDLAIGAFIIQLSVLAYHLTGESIASIGNIKIDVVIAFALAVVWVICIWLPIKNKPKALALSYIMGTAALAASTTHILGIHNAGIMAVIEVSALGVGGIGYLLADLLHKEAISHRFEDLTKNTTAYDMIESCRKFAAGLSPVDPMQQIVDIIRGAIRNRDDATAVIGIRAISDLGIKLISESKSTPLIAKHLNSHLYQIGVLADMENDTNALYWVIDTMWKLGYTSSQRGSESSAVETLTTMESLFGVLKDDVEDETPMYRLATGAGKIGVTSAGSRQVDAVEKTISLLKHIGTNAILNQHNATVGGVRYALVETAKVSVENNLLASDKQIVTAFRDIGIKASQQRREGQKPQMLWQVLSALRELGDVFEGTSLDEVIWALRDIGVLAARRHFDTEVSRVIAALEHAGESASEKGFYDAASQSVMAISQICEVLMKEHLKVSTGSAATALARLGKIDALAVVVNDAVFELGKYRDLESEMYTLFDKTYRKISAKV